MRILTWNLGLYSWFKYAHYFGIKLNNEKIQHEYFQKQHLHAIVDKIIEINPNICILQEFHDEIDRQLIISKLKEKYPCNSSLNAWYRKHTIMIFSLEKIEINKLTETGFYILKTNNFSLIPIHLNSFSAKKRLEQVKNLILQINNSKEKINCIAGDTNFWCFGKKPYFIFQKDKIAYNLLKQNLNDSTQYIGKTIKCFMNFDKIFLSKELKFKNPTCIRKNEKYMDHFPVFVDIE